MPLNTTVDADSATKAVIASVGAAANTTVFLSYYVSGDPVGPGENAYVFPCKSVCCNGLKRPLPVPRPVQSPANASGEAKQLEQTSE